MQMFDETEKARLGNLSPLKRTFQNRSAGQTGADRVAFDWVSAKRIECGG
jgi:hypothetical protein